jgi:fructokinase
MLIGVETGGTTVVCAAAAGPTEIVEQVSVPTTTPQRTLAEVAAFVARHRAAGGLDAVGVGAFGPVDLDPHSRTFGVLGATPKRGWAGTRLLDPIREAAGCPVALETDVTAAALGEQRHGAGVGLRDLAYVTVGTGIGLGAIVDGRPLHGTAHPEAGHLSVRRHPTDDFAGVCRLHGDCLEGLASGPAVAARWGRPAEALGDLLEPAVPVEASYLAQLVAAVLYVLSPARVVLGGGVAQMPGLLDAVRRHAADLLAGALGDHPASDPSSGFLTQPALGSRAGVVGALVLAADLVAGTSGRWRHPG